MTEAELFAAYASAGDSADAMTESDLLEGITTALTLAGWRWTHIRRSDGITMGNAGLPDIIAVHPTRGWVLAWELKTAKGAVSPEQLEWIHGFRLASTLDARIVRPGGYDDALAFVLGTSASLVRGRRVAGS